MSDEGGTVVPLRKEDDDGAVRVVAGHVIPAPPPGSNFDRQQRRMYDWICVQLIKSGRKVDAAGIQIMLLVHTLDAWSKDLKDCIALGRYGESEKGNRYELPHSFNERAARESIKRELPEACLTVMSGIEARLRESKIGESPQDDLFADLVDHASKRPSAA